MAFWLVPILAAVAGTMVGGRSDLRGLVTAAMGATALGLVLLCVGLTSSSGLVGYIGAIVLLLGIGMLLGHLVDVRLLNGSSGGRRRSG